MNKKAAGVISICSILLSPLLGGGLGKMVAGSNILALHSAYSDDGLSYIGALAWIAASIMFYVVFSKKEDHD